MGRSGLTKRGWLSAALTCAGLLLSGCASLPSAAPSYDLAITHVTVIPMDRERTLADQTVLIRNGKIAAVTPAGRAPQARKVIDGAGKFLIPALADMHVHIAEPFGPRGQKRQASLPADAVQEISDEVFLYTANGVTLVRNMDGWPLHLQLREQIRAGKIIGPEIYTAGPIVHGPGNGGMFKTREAALGDWAGSPAEAEAIVNRQLDAGYDFIKVYNAMAPDSYAALVATAHKRGAKVGGHVPFDVGINGILAARQDSIEHLRGYDIDPNNLSVDPMSEERFTYWFRVSDALMQKMARATKQAGTYNVPTQVVGDGMALAVARARIEDVPGGPYMTPGLVAYQRQFGLFSRAAMQATLRTLPQIQAMIRALKAEGAPLMAGTDTPIYYSVPGFALHRELKLYADNGFTPFEALQLATIAPSAYLGREKTRGQIAQGFQADTILLNANPLVDITNTTKIAAVIQNGVVYDRAMIDARLAEIAARQKAAAASPP